jgi:hypothetical protein
MYPAAKSVGAYLKAGWHVTLAYVVGFFVLFFVHGWHVDVPSTRMGGSEPVTTPPPAKSVP